MFKSLFGGGAQSTLVESAFRDVSNMLQQSARMYDLAIATLIDNQPLEADLDSMDDEVDIGERMVRRAVLEHLSMNPAQDLVASLVLVSMVQDAERIGDFARGLADIATLAKDERSGPWADELGELAARVRGCFEDCTQAFVEDDNELARMVIGKHIVNKKLLAEYLLKLTESDLNANMAIVYAVSARVMSRVSAHLSNIASSVVQPYDRIRHGDEEA